MAFVNDQSLHSWDVMRSMQGPAAYGWVQSQLTIIQRRWFGGQIGAEGGSYDTTLVVNPYYEVNPVTTAQIMASGGQYEMGNIRVGPITPPFNDQLSVPPVIGGYSEAQLHPVPTTDDVQVLYSITGRHAGEYQFVALESWDPTGFYLVLERMTTKPVEP